jgi:class 3 adenylate cyclase/TolB-like protein
MAAERVTRKLAAILVSDVVAYSRLASVDEEGTLARLRSLSNELIDPTVSGHRGRTVKRTGDGLLVEFRSVVDAVRCAIAIQNGMTERNIGVPLERRMQFRIGIHLGDVVQETDNDLMGDGVNIAARLESIAEPGGICLSEDAYRQVRGKISATFGDLGNRQLKNIAHPVRTYRVVLDRKLAGTDSTVVPEPRSTPPPRPSSLSVYRIAAILAVVGALTVALWAIAGHFEHKKTATPETALFDKLKLAPRLSIVVLPFSNLSDDAGKDYFADGITDSLITGLSRSLPGSFVVARATAFTYKGKATDARQIGRDLDVRYALEGSVFFDGELVRINARLVDAQVGNEIWGDRFDTSRGDLLNIQDEIVDRLARAIGLQVISFAAQRSARDKTFTADAVDLVLRGEAALNRPSSMITMFEARSFFEQALALQSDNVDAIAGVAATFIFEVLNGYYPSDNEARLQRAEPLVKRALALDNRNIIALKANAALLRAQGRFEDGIVAAQLIIDENPAEPWAYKEVALSLMYLGRTAESLPWFEKAELIGPRDPGRWTWLGGKGQALILLRRDAQAIVSLRAAVESNPADVGDYAVLAAAYALTGRDREAHEALGEYSHSHPETTVSTFRNVAPVPLGLTDPSYRQQRERLKDGLRKAGMPE